MNGGIYSTGNEIVDENAKLNISGNIIPQVWYRYNHQRKRKAKSDSHYYTGRYCVLV